MIRVLIILVLFLNLGKSTAQEFTDTITIKHFIGTAYYRYQDKPVTLPVARNLFKDVPAANEEFIKSKKYLTLYSIMYVGFLGTAAWAIFSKNEDTQHIVSGVSVGLLVGMLPLAFHQNNHAKKAVLHYNKHVLEYNKYKQRNGEL